jgi:DNA topoisomerase-1
MTDAFAIRPGSSSSSHVRGVTTLKAPNVTVRDAHVVALDFVGKDSIRYNGEMRLPAGVVRVIKGRIQSEKNIKLFPRVTASALNEYLDELMPGLTAKVIRTYRASCTYQHLLYATPVPSSPEEAERRLQAAATGAAMLCNHQHETRACARKFAPDKDVHSALHALKKSMHNSTPIQKDETQCWARQTTLANYIDPRITVAYCKQHDVPIERVYPRGLRTRFKWAITGVMSNAAARTAVQYKFCSREGT